MILLDRIGIHIGEVTIEERPGSSKSKDLYGWQGQLPNAGESVTAGLIPGSFQQAFVGGVSGENDPAVHAEVARAVVGKGHCGGD